MSILTFLLCWYSSSPSIFIRSFLIIPFPYRSRLCILVSFRRVVGTFESLLNDRSTTLRLHAYTISIEGGSVKPSTKLCDMYKYSSEGITRNKSQSKVVSWLWFKVSVCNFESLASSLGIYLNMLLLRLSSFRFTESHIVGGSYERRLSEKFRNCKLWEWIVKSWGGMLSKDVFANVIFRRNPLSPEGMVTVSRSFTLSLVQLVIVITCTVSGTFWTFWNYDRSVTVTSAIISCFSFNAWSTFYYT